MCDEKTLLGSFATKGNMIGLLVLSLLSAGFLLYSLQQMMSFWKVLTDPEKAIAKVVLSLGLTVMFSGSYVVLHLSRTTRRAS